MYVCKFLCKDTEYLQKKYKKFFSNLQSLQLIGTLRHRKSMTKIWFLNTQKRTQTAVI